MMKYLFLILVITTWQSAFGQDISLLHLQGTMPGTFINPALILDKKINVSLAQIYLSLGTDGPSLNTPHKQNTSGQRYIDIKNYPAIWILTTTCFLQMIYVHWM
ncbi:MAG: hypothetical protein IPP49_09000 [Saprospiraceae bacterium]|nr:hypothetical protein [Saprospiraceae bacterium]